MSHDRLDNVLAIGRQDPSDLFPEGNGEITFFQALLVLIKKIISAAVSAVFSIFKMGSWIISMIRQQWKLNLSGQRKDSYKKIQKVQSTLQQGWNTGTTRSADGKSWASNQKPSLSIAEDVRGLDDIFPNQITSFFGEETRGLPVQEVFHQSKSNVTPQMQSPPKPIEKSVPETIIQAVGIVVPDAAVLEKKMRKNGTSGEEDFTFQSMLQNNKILSRSIANLADSYFTRAAEEANEAEYLY